MVNNNKFILKIMKNKIMKNNNNSIIIQILKISLRVIIINDKIKIKNKKKQFLIKKNKI